MIELHNLKELLLPVRLGHTIFENGILFRGEPRGPFDLGLISFKGVDLSKEAEFSC